LYYKLVCHQTVTAMLNPKRQAAEELRSIRRLMERTRQTASQAWIFFVIWGVGGTAAALASEILVGLGRVEQAWVPQIAYWPLCVTISLMVATRQARSSVPLSFVDGVVRTTWTAIAGTMLVLIAACSLRLLPKTTLGPLLAIESGVGCMVTATLVGARPLYLGAIAWWVGGTVMFAQPQLGFVLSAMLFPVAYLLPGLSMRPKAVDEPNGSRA
jgi:hypothetical protein